MWIKTASTNIIGAGADITELYFLIHSKVHHKSAHGQLKLHLDGRDFPLKILSCANQDRGRIIPRPICEQLSHFQCRALSQCFYQLKNRKHRAQYKVHSICTKFAAASIMRGEGSTNKTHAHGFLLAPQ